VANPGVGANVPTASQVVSQTKTAHTESENFKEIEEILSRGINVTAPYIQAAQLQEVVDTLLQESNDGEIRDALRDLQLHVLGLEGDGVPDGPTLEALEHLIAVYQQQSRT